MSQTTLTRAYYFDVSDDREVVRFPEDFASWLMDEGNESDAREFLVRCRRLEEITPPEELSLDIVIGLAEEYAPVVEINEEFRLPSYGYREAIRLFRDIEATDEPMGGDEPLPWDREAAIVNRTIEDSGPATPVNMAEHEYPDVHIYVVRGESILEVIWKAVIGLAREGYSRAIKDFAQSLIAFTRIPRTDAELFGFVWSYVDIHPVRPRNSESLADDNIPF